MTPAPAPPLAGTRDGLWLVDGARVRWRSGTVAPGAAPGDVARMWIEEVVRADDLFPWRGFAPSQPHTKPRLAGDTGADFSIAHSGRTIAVAVATGARVGIDVEAAPFRAFRSPALRRRMLSAAEHRTLAVLPADEREGYLARVWTAKEAFVKATGEGLGRDFRRFSAPVAPRARTAGAEAALVVLTATGARSRRIPFLLRTSDRLQETS